MPLTPSSVLLTDRVVLVTGAAQGIGAAVAGACARFGADLAICDRESEGLAHTAAFADIMYFFGYGNFLSSSGGLGVRLAKHVGLNVGYQLGSRLTVTNNNSSDRIGLRLTQKGALAGFEFPF